MASIGIISVALIIQIAVSIAGTYRLASKGFGTAWRSCLVVPAVILLYAIWIAFDANGITEGGARILIPLAAGLLVFIVSGFVAAVVTYRLSK